MKHTPGLWHIVLGLLLIVMRMRPAERSPDVWDERLVPPAHGRQYHNPRRNRERWARRLAKRRRQWPPVSRAARRPKRAQAMRQILQANPPAVFIVPPNKPASPVARAANSRREPIAIRWTKRIRWPICGRRGDGLTTWTNGICEPR